MTRSMSWLVAIGLAVALLACGCGAASPRPGAVLLDDVRGYNDGVRWNNPSQAALRVPPAEREDFLDERDEIADDLRIGDYEIINVRQGSRGHRATIHVKWTWHLDSRGIVHTTTSEQRWQLHGKQWLLVSETRLRGEKMPGVAEPSEDEVPTARTASKGRARNLADGE